MAAIVEEDEEFVAQQQQRGPSIHKNILEIFWKLAEVDDKLRENAAALLIVSLKPYQTKHEKANNAGPCREVQYALDRLLKGISSSRQAARLGYYVALVELLRAFPSPSISSNDIFPLIQRIYFINNANKKDVPSLIGLSLAYGSVLRSGIRVQDPEHFNALVSMLYTTGSEKIYMEGVSCELLRQLMNVIDENTFKAIFPIFKDGISVGWKACSPFTLWLLMESMDRFPKVMKGKFLDYHWEGGPLIKEKNFPRIAQLMMQSTSMHPNIHPMCLAVISKALNCANFPEFWGKVVDDTLVPAQNEKIYLAFRLVKEVLQEHLTSAEQIKSVLSPTIVKHLMHKLEKRDMALHGAACDLAASLAEFVERSEDPQLDVAVVMQLVQKPGTILFDNATRTKTLSNILHKLKTDSIKKVSKIFKAVITDQENSCLEPKVDDLRRGYAAKQLVSLVLMKPVAKDVEWQAEVLKFLALHAFFDFCESETARMEGVKVISSGLHGQLRDAFFKALDGVMRLTYSRSKPSLTAHFNLLLGLVDSLDAFMKEDSTAVTLHMPLSKQSQEAWDDMLVMVRKLQKRSEKHKKNSNESNVFQILLMQVGFQLFTDPKRTIPVLQELQICCSKLTQKRKVSEDELMWIDVVVDLLLSLLSQDRCFLRTMVRSVFGLLANQLTVKTLHQILDVINPEKGEEEPLMEEELESSSGEDDELESDDDELEEEETKVNDVLRMAVQTALGCAEDESDVNVSDMDEEMMNKLDETLAEAFRSQSRGKKKEEDLAAALALMHFRCRCLDLIEGVIDFQLTLPFAVEMVIPLIATLRHSVSRKDHSVLCGRVSSVIKKLASSRKFMDSVEEITVDKCIKVLGELLDMSNKVSGSFKMIQAVCELCSFLIRCINALQKLDNGGNGVNHSMAIAALYKKALKNYLGRRNNDNLPEKIFTSFIQIHPDLAWGMHKVLLKFAFRDDINSFRKIRCLSLLVSLVSNTSTLKNTTAEEFSKFTEKMEKFISKIVMESNTKVSTKYIHAVFTTYNNCLSASKRNFNMMHPVGLDLVDEPTKNLLEKLPKQTQNVVKQILNRSNLNGKCMAEDTENSTIPNKKLTKRKKIMKPNSKIQNGQLEQDDIKQTKRQKITM